MVRSPEELENLVSRIVVVANGVKCSNQGKWTRDDFVVEKGEVKIKKYHCQVCYQGIRDLLISPRHETIVERFITTLAHAHGGTCSHSLTTNDVSISPEGVIRVWSSAPNFEKFQMCEVCQLATKNYSQSVIKDQQRIESLSRAKELREKEDLRKIEPRRPPPNRTKKVEEQIKVQPQALDDKKEKKEKKDDLMSAKDVLTAMVAKLNSLNNRRWLQTDFKIINGVLIREIYTFDLTKNEKNIIREYSEAIAMAD